MSERAGSEAMCGGTVGRTVYIPLKWAAPAASHSFFHDEHVLPPIIFFEKAKIKILRHNRLHRNVGHFHNS